MRESKVRSIVETLRKTILSGCCDASRPLPSVAALMKRFGVARATVVAAVKTLEREGLVVSKPGSGTFVKERTGPRKIGLILPGVAVSDFFKPVLSEINRLARDAGYELRFGEEWREVREERIAQVRELAAEFIDGDFAGVIYEPLAGPIGGEINPRILDMFDRKGIPVVLLDCDIVPFPERSRYDVVGVNDLEAGARMAKHLVDAGAKHIHFLICELCPTTFLNRLAGAESQLKLAGVKFHRGENVLHAEADDLKALKRYLKRQRRRPDAFVCSNDAIAAVFRQSLEKAGLRVPQDVMLTGFADLPIATLMTPTLTTVRQNREQMAQAAFRRLVERIADPSLPPCDVFLPAPLVIRGSTERAAK